MRNTVNNYVEKFKQERRKRRRTYGLLFALALVVTAGIWWQLHSTGIAMTNETYCGLEEHTHDESCYEKVLVCGLEETEGMSDASEGHTHDESCYETVSTLICGQEVSEGHTHDESCYDEEGILICGLEESEGHTHTDECYENQEVLICVQEDTEGVSEASEGHTHTEDCYELQLICGKKEHTHTIKCITDESADVETADVWTATLPGDLTGVWADDVVSIALSQADYTESTANFILADDGETRQGYTRYGAWYGNAYGNWDAMFASFCLYYAGVDENVFPEASGAYAWTVELDNLGLYADAADYTPAVGDLVFFDTNADDNADRVGIVEKLDVTVDDDGTETVTKIYVIEGDYAPDADSTDAVCEVQYQPDDETIAGYGTLSVVSETNGITAEESDTAETAAESEKAAAEAVSVSGSRDFAYEDENVSIQIHAEGTLSAPVVDEGTAEAENEAAAASAEETGSEAGLTVASLSETDTEDDDTDEAEEISWDSVTMEVTVLDEESESYALLAEYADELTEENSELSILEAVSFSFYYDGEEVDASDWTLTAEVTPVEQDESAIALIDEDEEESEEETETSDATVTYTLLETADGDVNEADAATVSSGEEEMPTLAVSEMSANSVIMLLAANAGTTDFTVEYYAYLDVVKTSTSSGTLALLDTSGGILPSNTTSNAKTYINLIETSSGYQIETEKRLTEIYTSEDCTVEENNDVDSVNKLRDNSGYTLSEVWVSADNGANWTEYVYEDGMEFTNVESSADDTSIIYIPEDALVRLVYNTATASENIAANLYDYDITDNGTTTTQNGINSSSNYAGSGTKLTFGNSNAGVSKTLSEAKWNEYYINMANSKTVDYSCSFGIAAGLTSDGIIIYSSGIDAPALFNESNTGVIGKTTYSGQTLTFSQVGDTYTLSSVSGPNGYSITNLEYFTKLTNYVYSDGTAGETFWNNSVIYTNSFWPMDGVTGTDGQHGHYGETGSWCPVSDDSKDHNSYFGMQYSVEFTLTKDYCGPLNYLFFGDDDMWVFLTDENGNSTLICDIGGVHSSVGEYVNLWDYISLGSSGTYTLTFFYTERGASGSTCYTQFTLPSVTSSTKVQNTGDLKVEKKVDSDDATGDETFDFTLSLKNSSGSALANTYAYDIFNSNGSKASSGTIGNDGTFSLKDGQYIHVEYLPVGTVCTVTETDTGVYAIYTVDSSNDLNEGNYDSGSITSGGTLTMKFVNSTPDVEKKVQDNSGNWVDENTTYIGSNVQFKTTISDVSNVTNLVLHDKLDTGLANPNISGVFVLDSAGTETQVVNDNINTYYTYTIYVGTDATTSASATDDCSFEIEFKDDFLATLNDSDCIVVYYRATLTSDAKIGTTVGNENQTKITYGADSESLWKYTKTYTFQIDILKYSGDEELSGAEFILYYIDEVTTAEPSGGTSTMKVYKYAQVGAYGYLTGWTDVEANATTLTSDNSGQITVKGLDAGTYYLEETKAPDGYTLLSAPVTITVGSNGTVTYTVDRTTVDASTTGNKVKVENEPGYELPLTGGTGTYPYAMAGMLLTGGAAYLLYRSMRRRKGEIQF